MGYSQRKVTVPFVGADKKTSSATDLLGWQLVGIKPDANLTGTHFDIEVDPGDGTFYPVAGYAAFAVTVSVINLLVAGPPPVICGARIRLVSDADQLVADSVTTLLMRRL